MVSLERWFPFMEWMKVYDVQSNLRADLTAGFIVAIMLIPQGMAYAMLAGLPPVFGLYASTIPLIIYALYGSSRHLGVGPVAMVSLLIVTGVSELAEPGLEEYISYVLLLALMVGIIQCLLGLFKLGVITTFISHAVISGFTSAAAIIIGFSQLKHLFGIPVDSQGNVLLTTWELVQRIEDTHLPTLILGIISIVIIKVLKKWVPQLPGAIVVIIFCIIVVRVFQLDMRGMSIVGNVPSGLPQLTTPFLNFQAVVELLPIALTISFIAFVEAYAVGKVIASKENYTINANRELNGLGLANVTTSFFSGFPITGSFSRSAVNYESGAKTAFALIVTSVIVILTLLFFTPVFYYLPQTVLAAIILVAVYKLINMREVIRLWKVKRIDSISLLITFVATLTISIKTGIMIGIIFSLLVYVYRSAKPRLIELGYVESETKFESMEVEPDATKIKDTLLLKVNESIYFVNMNQLEEELSKKLKEDSNVINIIFDFSGVNDMDAVAINDLETWVSIQKNKGMHIYLVALNKTLKNLFEKAGWIERDRSVLQFSSIENVLRIKKT
ncbi:SulP family inorganic anion transporter [Evansella sp. AB-rgal1]|uniref:SulP family inorganic anion transporter n=1 Tax=Evansella sp. AB-rgal1 TaxID=3242696 RepID=UPI00359D1113